MMKPMVLRYKKIDTYLYMLYRNEDANLTKCKIRDHVCYNCYKLNTSRERTFVTYKN